MSYAHFYGMQLFWVCRKAPVVRSRPSRACELIQMLCIEPLWTGEINTLIPFRVRPGYREDVDVDFRACSEFCPFPLEPPR